MLDLSNVICVMANELNWDRSNQIEDSRRLQVSWSQRMDNTDENPSTLMTNIEENKVPWREGFFKMGPFPSMILQTSGENMLLWKNLVALDHPDLETGSVPITCHFGNFGAARKEIADATGVSDYNFWADGYFVNCKGVINEEGTKMTMWGVSYAVEEWIWLDEEMIEDIKNDRDSYLSPSCPHITPQPENQGCIFWLCGPPGSGKSTICQLMARTQEYIYYEADSAGQFINPFTDINAENPTVASYKSKPLKGIPRDVAQEVLAIPYVQAATSKDIDEKMKPFYKVMAEDITRQKERLGGTFAVAHAVAKRKSRDFLRQLIGPDLIFIVLDLTPECLMDRLKARHGEASSDVYNHVLEIYEPAAEDEENALNVAVDSTMSIEEVLQDLYKQVANQV